MFNTNDTSLENEDWFVPNEPDEVKLALSEDSEGSLYEDMLLLQSYSTEIDELTLEANEIETIIEKNDELGNIIKTADEELKKTGTISNETALSITNKYSEVSILLNINKEEINTESALKYKKEIYNLTKENSSDEHWLKRLLNKFIEFCRNVYYRVVEYATKLGIAITRQEVAATRLATYISDNLDNFKIDKWEYMIPYADIIGNFTILKNFTVGEIEKYVKFSNGGFESDRLVDLYKSCIDKKDLSKFKSLDGIPVEYDLKEYVLKDIENYIKDFVYTNDIDINYAKENAERIKDEVNIKTKLQSSLILLNKMNAPEELILLVRKKDKRIK